MVNWKELAGDLSTEKARFGERNHTLLKVVLRLVKTPYSLWNSVSYLGLSYFHNVSGSSYRIPYQKIKVRKATRQGNQTSVLVC